MESDPFVHHVHNANKNESKQYTVMMDSGTNVRLTNEETVRSLGIEITAEKKTYFS